MARARIIVLSSPRLVRLDGLLVASGATPGRVERVDDARELFEIDAAAGALLVADLKDVLADLDEAPDHLPAREMED